MSEAGTETSGDRRAEGIRSAWAQLRAEDPMIRAVDAAARLGVSEAELVAARLGDGVRALEGPWGKVVERLPELGTVMVLTRNAWAVHEKTGRFGNITVKGTMGLVLNKEVDLRLFLNRWRFGFAVEEETLGGLRTSLQFFACDGRAVHKVYLRGESDHDAFEAIVVDFADDDPGIPAIEPPPPPVPECLDAEIDTAALRARWDALEDVHDFAAMLDAFGVGRVQALRLAGAERVRPASRRAFRDALKEAAAQAMPIMVFVGNPGAIQIHTGTVRTLKDVGPWFNVLDPGFNLHLREEAIASAWVVTKPTRDGPVTSLEIYDSAGKQIALMFGARKPGQPERADWRALADGLATSERA